MYQVKTKITHCTGPEPVVFEVGMQIEGAELGPYLSDHLELGSLVPAQPAKKPKKTEEVVP